MSTNYTYTNALGKTLFFTGLLYVASQFGLDKDKAYDNLAKSQANIPAAGIFMPITGIPTIMPANTAFAEAQISDQVMLDKMCDLTRIDKMPPQEQKLLIYSVYSYIERASIGDAQAKNDLEQIVNEVFEASSIPSGTMNKDQLSNYLYNNSWKDPEVAKRAQGIATYLNPSLEANTANIQQQQKQEKTVVPPIAQPGPTIAQNLYPAPAYPVISGQSSPDPKAEITPSYPPAYPVIGGSSGPGSRYVQPKQTYINVGINGNNFTLSNYEDPNNKTKNSSVRIGTSKGAISSNSSTGPGYNSSGYSVNTKVNNQPVNMYAQNYNNNKTNYSYGKNYSQVGDARFGANYNKGPGYSSESYYSSNSNASIGTSTYKNPYSTTTSTSYNSGNININVTTEKPNPVPAAGTGYGASASEKDLKDEITLAKQMHDSGNLRSAITKIRILKNRYPNNKELKELEEQYSREIDGR